MVPSKCIKFHPCGIYKIQYLKRLQHKNFDLNMLGRVWIKHFKVEFHKKEKCEKNVMRRHFKFIFWFFGEREREKSRERLVI